MHHRFVALACLLVAATAAYAAAHIPAFPGAEGAGALARGGRGGRVIYVTNLNDRGPGSLRAAVETKGPRLVLFGTAGDVELQSPLEIKEPFITVAGQTAPGGGICLKNYELVVSAHDVVIRYLRVRPGDLMNKAVDGMSIGKGSQNVIVDHCSVGWSVDESLSVSGDDVADVTVQWCLIAESLSHSVHHKGPHGYGSLIRAHGDVSYHHNVYAHHSSRNPRPGTYGDPAVRGIVLDFRNNLIYGWGSRAGYSSADRADINYVGNYLKPNASSKTPKAAFNVGGTTTRIYVAGNFLEGAPEANQDNWKMITSVRPETRMEKPFPIAPVITDSTDVLYEKLLADIGATKPQRDAVDERVIRQIRTGTGKIIDSQNDVGGWPQLAAGKPAVDSDGDGMPDEWESRQGLNPRNAGDGITDADGDGYTNVEEFLNGTNPRG